jgi:hypothetical protein
MRVLLSVYGIKIKRSGNEQVLSNFGNSVDFLKKFHDFAEHIFVNIQSWQPNNKSPKYSLTCLSDPRPALSNEEREAYGFFDAGRDGDRYRVKDYDDTSSAVIHVNPKHSTIRDVFYYLYVPQGRTRGYLVLQVPFNQGIKGLIGHCFQDFLNQQGLSSYRIEMSNLVNDKVFYNMMETGSFKELTVTKYGLPINIDDYKNKDSKPEIMRGSIKTIYQAPDLGKSWKDKAMLIFGKSKEKSSANNKGDERVLVEILDSKDEYDEVSMKVEVNGKQKTFHVSKESRTLPDIDVTDNITVRPDGKLELNDLLKQARELVQDVTDKVSMDDLAN